MSKRRELLEQLLAVVKKRSDWYRANGERKDAAMEIERFTVDPDFDLEAEEILAEITKAHV